MKIVLLTATMLLLCASAAQAQVSYVSNNLPAKTGDQKRVICETEETIGTRLATKKICLTAGEWNQMRNEHRDFIERIQSGAWARGSADPATIAVGLSTTGPQ